VWLKKRLPHKLWTALSPVERATPGREPRQRPSSQVIKPLEPHVEDSIYQMFECGRVLAEMVRPSLDGEKWGGYADVDHLRIAGLARSIQVKLKYPHMCSPAYCLKDRSSCRFFFPWRIPSQIRFAQLRREPARCSAYAKE